MTRQFHEALIGAWGSWGPALSPEGHQVAFVSDRRGVPELWVQAIPSGAGAPSPPARVLPVGEPPICSVYLVRRRGLAGMHSSHRRRGADPGMGRAPRR